MDNANVPTAPRYKTPTPDQINSTQPIPDHIVSIVIFYFWLFGVYQVKLNYNGGHPVINYEHNKVLPFLKIIIDGEGRDAKFNFHNSAFQFRICTENASDT